MADLPELPATRDPFELLGVRPDVDERELKRAYVRLIKVYRPERAPQEFQRIQEAYEAARRGWGVAPPPGRAPADASTESPPQPSPPAARPQPGAWSELADEAAPPETPEPAVERTLDELVAGLRTGEPVAVELLERLSDGELRTLVGDQGLDWTVLCRQQPRWAALEILHARFEALLFGDRVTEVLDEAESPDLQRDLLADARFETLVLFVACAAFWEEGERATHLFEKFAGTLDAQPAGEDLARLFFHLKQMDKPWRAVQRTAAAPTPLLRFLRLALLTDEDYIAELARGVVEDLGSSYDLAPETEARRRRYLRAMDAMAQKSEDLLEILQSATTEIAPPPRAPLEGPMEEEGLRVLTIFEQMVDGARGEGLYTFFGCFLLVGVPLLVFTQGWIGLLWGLGLAVALLLPLLWKDNRFHGRYVRLRFLGAMQELHTTPEELLLLIRKHKKVLPELDTFAVNLEDDQALAVLSAMIRLGAPEADSE